MLRQAGDRDLRLEKNVSTVDLEAKIPNNVGLRDNKRLLRALEHWQPAFLQWWKEMGPTQWITHFAVSSKPGVITARPVARVPPGSSRLRSRNAAMSSGPAARWMAPSTPPPPMSMELAALAMASVSERVMSPCTSSMTAEPRV